MVTRSFLVLAAILMVGAFALALLPSWDMSLREAIEGLDVNMPERLRSGVTSVFGPAFWRWTLDPLLQRPSWLMPAALGLICVGGAVTAYNPPGRRTKRRSFPK